MQKSGVLEILLYLRKYQKASRKDLRDNIDVALETLYKTSLPTLKRLNLIEENVIEKFPRTIYIRLTEKGMKIAEKLSEINELLEGA